MSSLFRRLSCFSPAAFPSPTRVIGGPCNHMFQGGQLLVRCTCHSGIFDIPLSSVAPNCTFCSHPASQHESVSNGTRSQRSEGIDNTPMISNMLPRDAPFVSPKWSPRPVVAEGILERAFKYRVVLVRGTPACGKTTLMYLIHCHILEKHPALRVTTFHGWPTGMRGGSSKKYLESKTRRPLAGILCAQDMVVFIDDAQSSYYDGSLWYFLKCLRPNHGAYFILFSSYGSPGPSLVEVETGTPPVFGPGQTISLHWGKDSLTGRSIGILLRKDEAEDVITRYCINSPNPLRFSRDLQDHLITLSRGHAGALNGLIKTVANDPSILASRAQPNGGDFTIGLELFKQVFCSEPTSIRLWKGLFRTKFASSLPHRTHMQGNVDLVRFLGEMSRKRIVEASKAEQSEYKDAVLECYRKGWIHKVLIREKLEAYMFASPLHLWHCQGLLLSTQSCTITARSPIALAVDIIKLMRPLKLSVDCALSEDRYRKEFYRASGAILDGGVLWSPEFSDSNVKKGGSLDLYLAAKKWGLEFTRKEAQLSYYHQWISTGELLDWVLIDFRSTVPTLPHPELPMLYHVCFLRDFTAAKVMNNSLDVVEEFPLLEGWGLRGQRMLSSGLYPTGSS